MAGTTFPERLKSLFAYNFHRCVGNNHKIVLACGGVCGSGGGGVGSWSVCWGVHDDATPNDVIGNEEKNIKKTMIYSPNL